METKTVVGMGEMLLRLTAPDGIFLKDATNLKVNYGGAEANVLISLSSLGFKTRYLTRLGTDSISEAAFKRLLETGVDTSYIKRDEEHPLGIYFLENGEGARPSKVVYHRKYSAASYMKPSDFAYAKAFKDAQVFYVSGITLEISSSSAMTALKAVQEAKKKGLLVVFDFNYRSKLMSVEEAKKIYSQVAPLADIVFASAWDIKTLLDFEPEEENEDKLFEDACKHFGYQVLFTKKRKVISARKQSLIPCAYTQEKKVTRKEVTFEIFDRIGAGDSFSAGCLYGYLKEGGSLEKALDYGAANCVLEQTTFGDQAEFTEEDLLSYLKSDANGDVQR